jgi:hypothetical protein
MPKTRVATAPPMTRAPRQSNGLASGSRELAMVNVRMKMVTAAPVKAQKMECHDQKFSRPPDPSIPITAPDPATPAQMPTALFRSSFE